MAKGFKSGGRDFEPGCTPGPGRPSLPSDLRKLRKTNRARVDRLIHKYLHLPVAGIKARVEHPETPALEVIVGRIVAKAIVEGNENVLAFLLNQIGVGATAPPKPKDEDEEHFTRAPLTTEEQMQLLRIARGEQK